jgi:hypothetical protein
MPPVTVPPKANEEWIVWWDIHKTTGGWSRATALTEAGALEQAQRFIKLGFFVYAIRDPSGAVYMGEEEIVTRFAAVRPVTEKEPRQLPPAPHVPTDADHDL